MTTESMAPLAVAEAFLKAQCDVDLTAARALATPDYQCVSPGGARTGLDGLFERLAGRYTALTKCIEERDVTEPVDGVVHVLCHGVMVGELRDGTRFADVRFLDRLSIRDGRVREQRIWNDFGQPRAGVPKNSD